ncbi:hypothetical protein CRE_08974 [Caenorhabditis remanei]|uniref:Serpentine receptor class r-10 n=1 Tax=Caenorhabditis remanei TaxID=31234 RepID=E3LIK1_CAERE|nr:hypothetical protein CRE_08974 [Caenorhabditis remanei]
MYHSIHIIQFISFLVSQFTNAVLLYLIYTKTQKTFGQYRYLMVAFSIYAIIYNYVDLLTQPLVLIEEQMYAVVNHGPLRYYPTAGYVLICMFGGSFGMCISLLSTQFFYRYLALCRPNVLVRLEGPKLSLIFIPPFLLSVAWFLFCLFGLEMSSEKQQILKIPLEEKYAEDSFRVTFVSSLYWQRDQDGMTHWNIRDCIGTAGLSGLMSMCCLTILFCGVKTYKKMNDVEGSMSHRTKELNRQLFITLSLQTLLPFLLMYIPVGLLFFLPLFEANIGFLGPTAAASTASYPAIEPLIAIFCITTFRKSLICYKRDGKVSSTAAISTA